MEKRPGLNALPRSVEPGRAGVTDWLQDLTEPPAIFLQVPAGT